VSDAITLRTFLTRDRFILNRWLGEAHVVAWFGARAIADAEIAIAQTSDSALVRIILCDDQPIGYVHAFDCALLGGARPAAMPDGGYVITAFIGAMDARGKGLGAAAIGLVRDEIFATSLTPSVAVMVPLSHERVVRALEKHRFQWREVWRDSALGACWILTSTR
jgi:aminoglycoside 6'-N-acetyltransferase